MMIAQNINEPEHTKKAVSMVYVKKKLLNSVLLAVTATATIIKTHVKSQ